MSGSDMLLIAVYAAYIVAPLISDELWLRVALLVTSIGFVGWGVVNDSPITAVANLLFIALSLRQVIRLFLNRRPVNLTDEQQLVYDTIFPSMTERQFLLFWHLGEEFDSAAGAKVIEAHAPVGYVSLLLDGALEVVLADGPRTLLPPALIGEMSFVRGGDATASADVICTETVRGRRWDKTRLYALNQSHPELTVPFLRSIGADLASKIRP